MRWFGLVILAVVLLAGCAKQGPRLVVAPDRLELEPGEEQPLTARLDGFEGEVVWKAEQGTIIGTGLSVIYRAPDFPADDVVTVTSKDDPRLTAEVRISVRAAGALSPRLEVSGDLALVFTRVGQTRPLAVRACDAAGKPLAGARVRVQSADPESFAVSYDDEGNPLVTALKDDVQSVPLLVRYQGYETRATAVFARLKPQARYLEPSWIREADGAGGFWNSVVLERNPTTASLQPGQVFFSGDAGAVWGRIDAVELGDDTVTLLTSPAGLQDVFSDLDYQAETLPLRVKAVWREGRVSADAGFGAGGARLEGCPNLAADPRAEQELTATATVRVRISGGELQEGALSLDLRDHLGLAATLKSAGEPADCSLSGWRVRGGRLSLLLARLQFDYDSSLNAFASGPAAEVALPPLDLDLEAHLTLTYQDGRWVPKASASEKAAPPQTGPRVSSESGGTAVAGLAARTSVGLRLLLPGEDAELARLSLASRLPLDLELPSGEPDEAGYQGPKWRLSRSFEAGLEPTGQAFHSQAELAASPQVWVESDGGGKVTLDLGAITPEPTLRLGFGSRPPLAGKADLWLRGGACEEAEECFSGKLQHLDDAEMPDGLVVWRPEKEQRGVYQVYPRLALGSLGERYPYTAKPRLVVVRSPDLSELPLSLSLRGVPGGTAMGVISYRNRPLWGVTPGGERVQLTSPLRVWLPADGFAATPASLETPPGLWGYQLVALACPKQARGDGNKKELRLFSNDPAMSEVVLPVTLDCRAGGLPRPELQARPTAGAAPLRVGFTLSSGGGKNCLLDFGDGSPRREWRDGSCPQKLTLEHVYSSPGRYNAVLLVSDDAGQRTLARAEITAK